MQMSALTKQYGPLPAWGWVGVIVGGVAVWFWIRGHQSGSDANALVPVDTSVPGTTGGGGGGGGGSPTPEPTPTPTPTPTPSPSPTPTPTPSPNPPPTLPGLSDWINQLLSRLNLGNNVIPADLLQQILTQYGTTGQHPPTGTGGSSGQGVIPPGALPGSSVLPTIESQFANAIGTNTSWMTDTTPGSGSGVPGGLSGVELVHLANAAGIDPTLQLNAIPNLDINNDAQMSYLAAAFFAGDKGAAKAYTVNSQYFQNVAVPAAYSARNAPGVTQVNLPGGAVQWVNAAGQVVDMYDPSQGFLGVANATHGPGYHTDTTGQPYGTQSTFSTGPVVVPTIPKPSVPAPTLDHFDNGVPVYSDGSRGWKQ